LAIIPAAPTQHRFLATSPYRAKYREAELECDGAAVTIAQLA